MTKNTKNPENKPYKVPYTGNRPNNQAQATIIRTNKVNNMAPNTPKTNVTKHYQRHHQKRKGKIDSI